MALEAQLGRSPRELGDGGEGAGLGSRLLGLSHGRPLPPPDPTPGAASALSPDRLRPAHLASEPLSQAGSPVWPGPTVNSPLFSTPTPIKLYLKCHLNYEIVAENCA